MKGDLEMRIKLDKQGRLFIPRSIQELIGMKEYCTYEVNQKEKSITIYAGEPRDMRMLIENRLKNTEIKKSEKEFLKKLLPYTYEIEDKN